MESWLISADNHWRSRQTLPIVERFEEYKSLLIRKREHLLRLFYRIGARLLEQDMFTCSKRLHGPLVVQTVWKLKARRIFVRLQASRTKHTGL